MSLRRLRELADQDSKRRAESLERQISRLQQSQAKQQFEIACKSVYPTNGHIREKDLGQIADKLEALVAELQERFWDFLIAERIGTRYDNAAHEANVLLFSLACAGKRTELRQALENVIGMLPAVAGDQQDFYDYLYQDAAKGLPPTPPFSQADFAKLIGLTYHQFQWERHEKRWQSVNDDAVKHKRLRRWRHVDADIQRTVLRTVREKFPEKLWGALRS
jgi:hypothetical protein